MSAITTHVLDTSRGRPAAGVGVVLERRAAGDQWTPVGQGRTDDDGRMRRLMADGTAASPGVYRLVFDTGSYFQSQGLSAFYPHVVVEFEVAAGESHYHVPLLLSPFAYSTYRGS